LFRSPQSWSESLLHGLAPNQAPTASIRERLIPTILGPAAVALFELTPSAMTRLNDLGPENAKLERRVGLWDVTETVWASPGVAPDVKDQYFTNPDGTGTRWLAHRYTYTRRLKTP
jgi:hypothetical protein